MSLNKYMHPRNPYKHRKPDFQVLAEKYPEFRNQVVNNEKGKLALDFKNPDAVRVLTACLLQEDYGLKIEIPPDRLVPTLPLRLNYILWIEDITKDWNKPELSAIDIGTGACCVYPILAVSSNRWTFLATEADDLNYSYAVKNLESNALTGKIKAVKVTEDIILEGVIGSTEEVFDFCMCNPPFFADHFEAQGLVSRTDNRPDAKTMSTASPQESIVPGGEIAFVRKMIEESNFLENRIRVYTTMLGKKASLAPLKEILRKYKIENFATTDFCQGKTMRWGLAWSFDKTVNFPKSAFSQREKEGKRSVVHVIPTKIGERREHVSDLVSFFKNIFSQFKIHCREGKQTKHFALLTLTAAENTWIHSRRKRRQMKREATAQSTVSASESTETSLHDASVISEEASRQSTSAGGKPATETVAPSLQASVVTDVKDKDGEVEKDSRPSREKLSVEEEHYDGKVSDSSSQTQPTASESTAAATVRVKRKIEGDECIKDCSSKRVRVDTAGDDEGSANVAAVTEEVMAQGAGQEEEEGEGGSNVKGDSGGDKGTDRPPAHFVLKSHMSVRVQGTDLAVELTWLDGEDIQLLHQLLQVLKNRLATRIP